MKALSEKLLNILCYQKIYIYIFLGHNIRMLEITIDNCHNCDLETIIDPNNS